MENSPDLNQEWDVQQTSGLWYHAEALVWCWPGISSICAELAVISVMWDQKTGRETLCTSNAIPCWASQHCTAIFLSSSCPCLTLHHFYVPVRSNRMAQSDRNVCFASVNGHCLWFMWFTVLCCRNNCLVWRRVVGVGDLTCLANL